MGAYCKDRVLPGFANLIPCATSESLLQYQIQKKGLVAQPCPAALIQECSICGGEIEHLGEDNGIDAGAVPNGQCLTF